MVSERSHKLAILTEVTSKAKDAPKCIKCKKSYKIDRDTSILFKSCDFALVLIRDHMKLNIVHKSGMLLSNPS